MEKEVKKTPMRKAVDRLIADGRIKYDKDLQILFKKSKSTISAYLNGKPGKDFVRAFEKHFELSLNEFEENYKTTNIEHNQNNHTEEYIKLLKEQNAFLQNTLKADLNEIKKTVETNLNEVLLNQSILLAHSRVSMKRDAQRYVNDDPVKAKAELKRVNKLLILETGGDAEMDTSEDTPDK